MKNKLSMLGGIVTLLTIAAGTLGGAQIASAQVDLGNISVTSGSKSVNVNVNPTDFTVTNGDKKVQVQGTAGVQVNTQNAVQTGTVNVTNKNGTINTNLSNNGQVGTVQVNSSNGSLNVLLSNSDLTDEQKNVVINLGGDTITLIKDHNDLKAYNAVVKSNYKNVDDITVENGEVRVVFNRPARFLGIFGTSIRTEVVVDQNTNEAKVQSPWYSFLFTSPIKTADIESSVSADLKNESNTGSVTVTGSNGSVTTQTGSGTATVSSSDNSGQITVQRGARAVQVITSKVGNSGSISVGSGDKKVDINVSR